MSFPPKKLHVVTMISNPIRFKSRYALYKEFEKHILDSGATLTTVEIAFGDRPFEITKLDNPNHIQLRTWFELWHKENALNLGIQSIIQKDPGAEYFAWVDADVHFNRPDWAVETIQQLQHYHVVQMWSHALDLTPTYMPHEPHQGFVYSWFQNHHLPPQGHGYGGYYSYGKQRHWHPGYAWAARREALDHLGGLIDWGILGAADHHMALGLIGEVTRSVPDNMSDRYLKKLKGWEERATKFIQKDIGYVSGLIGHHWHGKKADRRYRERWDIIAKDRFDPDLDLKKDSQGLWQLTDRSSALRDDIRRYFRERNEDSIDVE